MAETDWKEFECSTGVVLLYGPFPWGMYWDLMDRALQKHADPDVPTKTIAVLGGTEEVDDEEDPEYLKALAEVRRERADMIGNAALEFCVRVKGGLDPWEAVIERIAEQYASLEDQPPEALPPEGPNARIAWFCKKYAMRTTNDWRLIGKIQRFSQIEDEEVRRKVETFPGDVAGPEGDGAAAPGASEE
jgi:hypothetical protein